MIGKKISHFQILEHIGAGGMGVVYKAKDINLNRIVALKFIPPHLISREEDKNRFIQEARAASALDHANICTIYEIGQADDGQLFISMGYYEGETLQNRIQEQILTMNQILDVAIQIASGLREAHAKGIIHRDIKPANIIVTTDEKIKIVDFGLAKVAGQTKLTREGTTLGTVAYMSPEQLRGDVVDRRSDIWSLGVTLYEMLTGHLPFVGDYEHAVMYDIVHENPQSMHTVRNDISMELENIVNRVLAKNPEERYQNIDDLLVELKRAKLSIRSSDLATTGEERTRKRRFSVILLFLSWLVVLIIAGYFLFAPGVSTDSETGSAKWENSIAVLPFSNLSQDPAQDYFCDGMTGQILTSVSKLGNLKVISHTSVARYKKTRLSIPEISQELGVENILEGSVSKFGDRIRVQVQLIQARNDAHLWAEQYDYDYDIDNLFRIYDDISEKIAHALLQNLSSDQIGQLAGTKPSNTQAYEYYMKGAYYHQDKFLNTRDTEDLQLAEALLKEAIKLDPGYVMPYIELADLYNSAYNNIPLSDSAEQENLRLQKTYLEKALTINDNITRVQMVKGLIHLAENEFDPAFTSLVKSIRLNPNDTPSLSSLAWFYMVLGLPEHTAIIDQKITDLDPLRPVYWAHRATTLLYQLERWAEAEYAINKALTLDPNQNHALSATFWLNYRKKNFDAAEKTYRKFKVLYPGSSLLNSFEAYLFVAMGDTSKGLDHIDNDFFKSQILLILGRQKEALDFLIPYYREHYLSKGISRYLYLKNSYFLKDVRDHPRFQAILAEHKAVYEDNLKKYGDMAFFE